MTGGSSFEVHAEHAAAAIAAGLCDVVVSVYASTPRSDRRRSEGGGRPRRPGGGAGNDAAIEFEVPYGLRAPIAPYALAANRHMFEYGTTAEQLAAIAVQTRRVGHDEPAGSIPRADHRRRRARVALSGRSAPHARLLPRHRRRRRVRHDERRAGQGAFESRRCTCSVPRLRTTTPRPSRRCRTSRRLPVRSADRTRSGWQACSPADVDVLEGYDSFTITAAPASRGPRVLPRRARAARSPPRATLGPGGSIPMNTQGGGLVVHPPRHVRDVPAHRGDEAAPRRVRRRQVDGRRDRRGARCRLHPVGDVDDRPRNGGDAVSRLEPRPSDASAAVLGRHPRQAARAAVVPRLRATRALPPRRVPAMPRLSLRLPRGVRSRDRARGGRRASASVAVRRRPALRGRGRRPRRGRSHGHEHRRVPTDGRAAGDGRAADVGADVRRASLAPLRASPSPTAG